MFLKKKRGRWLAPGNIICAIHGIAVNVFSTTRAITLQERESASREGEREPAGRERERASREGERESQQGGREREPAGREREREPAGREGEKSELASWFRY